MGSLHVIPYLVPATVLIIILYWLSVAIYNLYFHPLAHVPGPRLNAAFRLPSVINRISGDYIFSTHRLHEKYGPYVRISPWEVSTISPLAWKEIYGHRLNGHGNMPKDIRQYYLRDPLKNGAQSMLSADDETHARQRRIFTHAFSDRALREQEPLLKHYTDLCVEKLTQAMQSSDKLDLIRFYNFTTFDFIADCVFGEPLALLENMEYNSWVMNVFKGVKFMSITNALRAYPYLAALLRRVLPKSLERARIEHRRFCTDRVDERLARGEIDHPDFWTLVGKAQEKDKGLTLAEMHTVSVLFMTAGTETTATLLSGLTYHLCMNPDKMKKLTDEIRGAFKSADDMTTVTLPKLQYLFCCLEEGLRIYPPVSLGLPRVVPAGGAEMDGFKLPPGTGVNFPHWPAYHSASNFARPDDFVPERWETTPPEEFKNDRRDAFNPFSNGPRNCIGKNLAYHEMRLILAKVLWHFDLELCPESKHWTNQQFHTLWEKLPLWVKLHPVVREK